MKQEKINICHILTRLDIGGMENGVVNICNGLDRSRFNPIIACINATGPMAARLLSDVKVFDLGYPEGLRLANIPRLSSFFRKNNIHIVHTHAWGGGSLYGILSAKLARVPIVINGEHGIFFTESHQVLAQRFLFKLCDSNLSVSETLKIKTNLILGVPFEKIHVIKNGVDTEKFSGTYPNERIISRLKRGGIFLDEGSFFVFSIGSLKPDKAQVRLLKAAKKIQNIHPEKPIRYIFVGDGIDRTFLHSFVEKEGLSDSVFFLGHRSDISELLSIAHILVSTSLDEGLSNVMLEAMSSGIPIIATRSPGSSELITDGVNGFLVEQEDDAQLSDKILRLFEDESLLDNMGSNARKLIHENYSIEIMVKGYEDFYSGMMKEKLTYIR